ncbi:HAD-IC family P-type ATPase [Collinsella tanakaei]|uniref:HAD-IC family P-type ATPase n=1 Tax=Collinsella tanakaei TaxID=626935 RepID=UPI001EF6297D|nr:HAD-IC family P-type ATPase [Collinsella tanakaei]
MADTTTADTGSQMPDTQELKGLTLEEVRQRIEAGKVNVNMELKTKSVRELIIENTCTLFNLINIILAVLVIATGSLKNLTFLLIVILNTGIGIFQALRSKRMVDKLTLLVSKRATVIRDGADCEIDLDQIVQDDLIRLGRGDQIPADAVVVQGEASVNESLLTGESDLIRKTPGSNLMSGSFIDSGVICARVEHVGAENYVARINNEAKYVKKVNSEIMNALNAIVRFASVIMVPLGIALFFSSAHESYAAWAASAADPSTSIVGWLLSGSAAWGDISQAILSTVGALLGMIPQGLVLLTSSVLAIATFRLARRKVLAQQLYCIETLARVDVLCLDKTGTITSGHMEVAGVYALDDDGWAVVADDAASARATEVHAALCGIARATEADANETCRAVLNYYARRTVDVPRAQAVIPFSSTKKWSGATFANGSFIMGAAQFCLAPDTFAALEGTVNGFAETCRVLVIAQVDGFTETGDMVGSARPIGLVTIRDEIRSSAADTIRYFKQQGVELNVISGDDPRTVSSIAKVVGIPGADAYVDATTLDTPARLDAAIDRYHVFGRVTPQQKRELVVALKRRGHTVAMTGDGVNDVLALKEADCSVAMAAGSDAARNVAEIVLVDNDFASMPEVVAEGRRSINNLQRSAALFLTKTLFSMGLAAICIFCPPYPFQPITMTIINFFCIGFPSFVLALEPNRARVRGRFLTNVLKRCVPASIAVLVACGLCMFAGATAQLDTQTLSTMCLIATASVSCSLIWRISWPFTRLRAALFICVIAGLLISIGLFPEFFSIAALPFGLLALTIGISLVGMGLFFALAALIGRAPERQSRSATGFGRGVKMSLGKRGRKVTSTGSAPRRLIHRVRSRVARSKETRELERAQNAAIEEVAREKADARQRQRRRVVQSSEGIKVKMGKRKR